MSKKHKIKINFLLGCLLLSMGFLLYAANVSAEDCSQLEGTAKDDCESLEKKAKLYKSIIELKRKQQDTITAQMQLIDQEQERTKQELSVTKEKVETLSEQVANLERDIKDKESYISAQRILLSGLIQSYYDYDQQGVLNFVLAESDFSEMFGQGDYIEQSSLKVEEALRGYLEAKEKLQNDYDQIAEKKDEHEKAKEDLEKKGLNLQYSESQKQKLLGQTQAEQEKYEQLLDDIKNEIDELETRKEENVDYSKLPAAKGGYFDYPVSSVRITQGYGKTSFSSHYASGRHNGVDFGVSYKPLYAVRSGTVIGSGDNGRYAYGKWIAVDHGDGLVTLYGHMSSKSVSKGDKIKGGEKIGTSGNTGFSTGPHLHFSVFVKSSYEVVESKYVNGLMIPTGASVNPMKYF